MLHIIQSLSDPLVRLVADDPVRPEISLNFRVGLTSEIFVLCDDQTHEPQAVVCCAYRDSVPSTVEELMPEPVAARVAVFYTIWSYKPGAGRRLIQAARRSINTHRPEIGEFVTLSPPTDMARRFHITNGASVLRVNSDTVNYLYP
jgi:hypothetical protein